MKVIRKEMVAALGRLAAGLSKQAILEQSDCFCFRGGRAYTFNGEIMARAKLDIGADAVVPAADFLKLLGKLPDDELEITVNGGEVEVSGQRRSAGLSVGADLLLPIDDVPQPDKWAPLDKEILGLLVQATRCCGVDTTQYLTTVVHVSKDRIESCDNHQLFRFDGKTGIGVDILIPASNIAALAGLELSSVAVGDGWIYFKGQGGLILSMRCSQDAFPDTNPVVDLPSPAKVRLPATLVEMVSRAEVMQESGHAARVGVKIEPGKISLSARKEGGWYREHKRIDYTGRVMEFSTHPDILREILKHGQDILVNDRAHKLKVIIEAVQYVASLAIPADPEKKRHPKEEDAPVEPAGVESYAADGDDIPF